MKVSVIVPTRGRPDDLARSVEAIATQHHAELEVIVVDDGSPEAVRERNRALAARWPGRVQMVELGASGGHGAGPSLARNAGLSAASGALVAFCDDDDQWTDPRHLARAADSFERDAALDLYVGNQVGALAGRVVRDDWLPALTRRMRRQAASAVASGDPSVPVRISHEDLCAADGFPHLNTVVLRRSVIDASGPFWPVVRYEEDRDFFWRALAGCRGVVACLVPMATHHIPDPVLAASASTRLSQTEKLLISAMVSRHVAISVRHDGIRRLHRAAESDVTRHLCRLMHEQGRLAAASQLSWTALSLRHSWKWLGYSLWLWVQARRAGAAS